MPHDYTWAHFAESDDWGEECACEGDECACGDGAESAPAEAEVLEPCNACGYSDCSGMRCID